MRTATPSVVRRAPDRFCAATHHGSWYCRFFCAGETYLDQQCPWPATQIRLRPIACEPMRQTDQQRGDLSLHLVPGRRPIVPQDRPDPVFEGHTAATRTLGAPASDS